jgi:uncharacterized protein YrrD
MGGSASRGALVGPPFAREQSQPVDIVAGSRARSSAMRIALGQDVFASDGVRVGTVDRVVLNDINHHVEMIIVHKGVVFASDKLIFRTLIDRVDVGGVRLTIKSADEQMLPDYYDGLFYESKPDGSAFPIMPYAGLYEGSVLYASPPIAGRSYPPSDGYFGLAPIDLPQGRPERNLSPDDVWISNGAEVVSADDHKLGHVHDVLFDAEGKLTGLIVRSGLMRKRHHVVLPTWIEEVDDDRIRLKVSAAEVESAANAEEERVEA